MSAPLSAPARVNADAMTEEELKEALLSGYRDAKNGNTQDALTAFETFRKEHGWERKV